MKPSDNKTPYRADEYDKNVRETIPYYEVFHAEILDLVRTLKPNVTTWLDTGCGTGCLAQKALAHFPCASFILADPSEAMLAETEKRLRDIPPARIRLIHAPTDQLGPQDVGRPVEVITATLCHHYLQPAERPATTKGCFDLLAPGGIYIMFENIRPACEQSVDIGLRRWRRFQLAQGRNPEVVEEHLRRFNNAYFPLPVDEHIDILKQSGFQTAELFWYSQMQAGLYAIKREN